jgi:hypothetical protein
LGTSGYVYFHFFLNAADPSGITVHARSVPQEATFTNQEIVAIEDANKKNTILRTK